MSDFQVISHLLNTIDGIPNNPRLPLLVYKNAIHLSKTDPASEFERRFHSNQWAGSWRDKIYSYHHYHSNNHEALGVFQGKASVIFGGDSGITLEVQAGDVIIIPAGVAHKCLSSSQDFGVVGAYPQGIPVDEYLGDPNEKVQATARIAKVAIPSLDPVLGDQGPLTQYWK